MQSGKKILLIDDDQYICQVVKDCLKLFGDWEIEIARSAEEGLTAVARDKPDAILLDMLLPSGMNGFAVIKKLKADPQFANIPIVLLTASTDLTEDQNFVQFGVQGAISKPCHPTKLVSQISHILGW